MKNLQKCERCAKLTSVAGLIAGIILAALKLTIGFLGRSHALIASGMCNLSDVTSALAVMIGVKYSDKKENKKYHYGYGKIEYVVQVGISAFMILGTIALILSSFIYLAKKVIVVPHTVVFFTAIISAIINGLIYKFSKCGAEELNSPALRSHAEHNKIDVASSLLVAVGVIVTRLGLHWADAVIAIFEGVHIIHGSGVIFWDGFKGLMDTSVPLEYLNEIKDNASEVPNVQKVTKVIARQLGRQVFIELSIELNPNLSVLVSKKIVQDLRAHLRRSDKHIGKIFVQIVPSGVLGIT